MLELQRSLEYFLLTLTLSLREKEQHVFDWCLAEHRRANSGTDVIERRSSILRLPRVEDVFTVAQIFNLPYRRFVIGRTLPAAGSSQVKNLRYSRLQVCATSAGSTLNTHLPEVAGFRLSI